MPEDALHPEAVSAPATGGEGDGFIFSCQSYSVQDGPGLRTTVFMKGCPLRCRWCHNPESIRPSIEVMVKARNCIGCNKCIEACPTGAILVAHPLGVAIDRAKCSRCLRCVDACAFGALTRIGQYTSADEVMAEVEKDEVFYRRSGGGVTVSGGEPLGQAAFVRRILESCRARNIHTVLDTSGFAPWPVLDGLLELVDLVLYDVKHMDTRRHLKGTGVRNELIVENLRRIPATKRKWIRVPLLANFNDSIENIRRTVELGLEVRAEKLSLLAYHDWGAGKYAALGRKYGGTAYRSPSDEHIEGLRALSEEMGLPCTVGS